MVGISHEIITNKTENSIPIERRVEMWGGMVGFCCSKNNANCSNISNLKVSSRDDRPFHDLGMRWGV